MRAVAAALALGALLALGACGKKGSPVRPDGRPANLPETPAEVQQGRSGVVEIENPDAVEDPSLADPGTTAVSE